MSAIVIRGIIYSGHGAPPSNIGLVNDFWMDIDTYVLYGPKVSNSTWAGAQTVEVQGSPGVTVAIQQLYYDGSSGSGLSGNDFGFSGSATTFFMSKTSQGNDISSFLMDLHTGSFLYLAGADGASLLGTLTSEPTDEGDYIQWGFSLTSLVNTLQSGSTYGLIFTPASGFDSDRDYFITGDGTLPTDPSDVGIGFGVESGGGNPHIEIVAPDSGTPRIDFTTPGTDYKARISYEDASGNFKLTTGSSLIDMSSGSVQIYGNSTGLTVNSDGAQLTGGTLTINSSYSLPATDGSSGQVPTTDGSGNVTWQTNSAVDPIGLIIALG